jgi:hypothetical protein
MNALSKWWVKWRIKIALAIVLWDVISAICGPAESRAFYLLNGLLFAVIASIHWTNKK